MKYYLEYTRDGMRVNEYDETRGVRKMGNSTAIYNGTLLVNALYDSAEAAIKSLNGYSKPVKMPDGGEIVPSAHNYPNSYEARMAAAGLKRWNSGAVETVAVR